MKTQNLETMEGIMLYVVLLSSAAFAISLPSPGNETDMLSLLTFKSQITQGSSSALSSWNDTNHFCNWKGVLCNSRKHPQRVTALDLSSLGLAGSISPSIANLTFLINISLYNNSFYGRIPPQLGNMRRLQLLDLSYNPLDGSIPANLAHCSGLTMLDLTSSTLSGAIPSKLGSLPKLSFLALSKNRLTGKIPSSIGNLSSLYHLALRSNLLEGSIPQEIGSLHSLQYFQLSDNRLSGTVPSSLYNLSSLHYFGLAGNKLEGTLPLTMGITLPNLQTIVAGGNHFKGPVPVSLANSSDLSFIDISINNLDGNVPMNLGMLSSLSQLNLEDNLLEASDSSGWEFLTSLTNCSQLKMLSLFQNNLSGALPNSIGNLSGNLQELRLNGNQISGKIPSSIENLVNLYLLALGPNLLTGAIPESIGKLKRLQFLTLYKSRLTGNIPSSFGNLTALVYLYISINNLDGPLPPSLGNLQQLEELGLSNNALSGTIPKQIFSISSLRECGLSHNSLVGSIPTEVKSMKFLRALYIAANNLTGEIPGSLGDCQLLDSVDVSQNLLTGEIPSSLGNLKALQLLDLSHNKLTGLVPDFLEKLSLISLNLSFNNFEGQVPTTGIFLNATTTSLLGNDKLCGGVPEFHLPSCHLTSTGSRGMSLLLKIVIATASALFCLLLLASLYFIYRGTKSRRGTSTLAALGEPHVRISYAELEKATDGFSSANLIGTGSFGSVYRGTLDHDNTRGTLDYDNTTVAVKVFNLEQQGASKSFTDECEALRNIRHRNLVKIITSCSTIDSKGDDFKALVFEFMPNGNLDTWLHAKNNEHHVPRSLSMILRLNIAIDVADALDYLHNDCQTPVIHCDLKPSNILLDNSMIAYVGDFGLARLLPMINKVLQDPGSSVAIRGTIGYVPPEYGAGARVSTSGDVYSYGILLLELFTGRRPTANVFEDGYNLHKFVEMAFPDRIMEVIDPSLLLQQKEPGNFKQKDEDNIDPKTKIRECLAAILMVGLSCSKDPVRERKSMRDIATELHGIRDSFIEDGIPQWSRK